MPNETTSPIEIRLYQDGDESGFSALAEACFETSKDAKLWMRELRWKLLEHDRPPATAHVAVTDTGQIVGYYGSVVRRFRVAGTTRFVGVPADNVIAPNYRGGRLQLDLFRAQKILAPTVGTYVGIGFPNPDALKVGVRLLGYREFIRLQVLHADLSPLRQAVRRIRAASSTEPGLRIERVEDFGPEFDSLWEATQANHPSTETRNSAYLRWRFRQHPNRDYQAFAIYRDQELRAYAVCGASDRADRCQLMDLFGHPDPAALRALVGHVLRWAAPNHRQITAWTTATAPYCQTLLDQGFRWYGEQVPAVYWVETDYAKDRPFLDPGAWYLTAGTTDSF